MIFDFRGPFVVEKKKPTMSNGDKPDEKWEPQREELSSIKEECQGRYVDAPLSYWDDGFPVASDADAPTVEGFITDIKMTRAKKPLMKAVVLFAPYDDNPESECLLNIEDVHTMMLDADYEPEKGSFFDLLIENPPTDPENQDSTTSAVLEKNAISMADKIHGTKSKSRMNTKPSTQFDSTDSEESSDGFFCF